MMRIINKICKEQLKSYIKYKIENISKSRKYSLLGPSCVGKSTRLDHLKKYFKFNKIFLIISAGNLVREQIKKNKKYEIYSTCLPEKIPSDIVRNMIKDELFQCLYDEYSKNLEYPSIQNIISLIFICKDISNKFENIIYDGYPRIIEHLTEMSKYKEEPSKIIVLEASKEVLLERFLKRGKMIVHRDKIIDNKDEQIKKFIDKNEIFYSNLELIKENFKNEIKILDSGNNSEISALEIMKFIENEIK